MADDRYNRDPRRNDYNVDNRRSNAGSNDDRSLNNPGSDWFRDDDDSRRDYGNRGDSSGSRRDDYRSRGSSGDRDYGADRGNDRSRGGGYDEYSHGGSRSFGDRYQTYDANRLDIGNYGRDRDENRTYGGYDRSAYGGDRFRDGGRDYGSQRDRDRSYGGQSYGGGERGNAQGGRGFWDKASDEVSSWFGDHDAERRREQDQQHRGRGPKNYSRSDERIRDDINDRLTDDNYVDASDIDVAVKDREVTLSGTVSDRNAKRRAEDIAEGVSGVSHVQNNIRVGSGTGTATTASGGSSGTAASSAAGGSSTASGSSSTSVDVDRSNTLSGGLGGRMGSTGTSGAGS